MSTNQHDGLIRPQVSAAEAAQIARESYGISASAVELGSNQDRNYLLTEADGTRSVLRIDNPIFTDAARDAQHAALDAYRAAGVAAPRVLPGPSGELTQYWHGFAVRRSEFAAGVPLVEAGYLAPVVIREFGELAASSVNALAGLRHPGLDRSHMWDMRVAHSQAVKLVPAIADPGLRQRVLDAVEGAWSLLSPLLDALPVQAVHGDLTDDNVMGVRGEDSRLHPHTVLDLGDLAYGLRVAELAVTVSALLQHDPNHPLRVLDAIEAFHLHAPLSVAEARAVWPLVVLRAGLLVASGWRQTEIESDNAYARQRMAGEQAIFAAANELPMAVVTELVLARLGYEGIADDTGLTPVIAPTVVESAPLQSLIPAFDGEVFFVDPGVESDQLDAGNWLNKNADDQLVTDAFAAGGGAAVFPYGVYRLTRTRVNSTDCGATWPADAEIWLPAQSSFEVTTPVAATVETTTRTGLVLELAAGWRLAIRGISPKVDAGAVVRSGDPIAWFSASEVPGNLVVGVRRRDVWQAAVDPWEELLQHPRATDSEPEPLFVPPELVPAWQRFSLDPATILGLESKVQRDEASDEQARREQIFASAQERYYEHPMQIERGWRHHLVDTTGRAYVDMVNNVSGLGHGHPGVADAANRQARLLNTNSRFLYRDLAEYSERLLATLPPGSGLDTVLLVNSGSEAVDLALRLAQAATGRKTVVALREAYHGWTMASDAVTTSAYDNPHALESRPDWVHIADIPNRFRGTYRGEASDSSVGIKYAEDLAADLDRLSREGRHVAGYICESALGNAGGVLLPDGYLAAVYRSVREVGGLCIADEVQVGFGRMGTTFWGFEQSGVKPDIVTIAKPMGNGFPIGGVITSKRVADALSTQGQFFSSAGGNPLSCRVGLAVLDAMEAEGLQDNARLVGEHLLRRFTALAEKHAIVGPIHGTGLYLGVELVRDRESLKPATAEAAAICERLRELGVIVLTTSERANVLKVKPPLCLTLESADFVVAQLDRVLSEGW